jgi:pimeloyl-ACP methyl ester carboxylesterase
MRTPVFLTRLGVVLRRVHRIVAPMKEAIVEHGGYRIRVRTRGPARGPHAIVLPGMADTEFTLAAQIHELRRHGYTTHVVELPGFGLPPALRKESARFPQLADLVLSTVDKIGVDRAVILGHSLGGGIALHIAMRRPAFVAGLILLAPASVGRSLVWTYKLFCLPLVGRALLRPKRSGSRRYLRYFLLGSKRRDDEAFIERLVRRDRHNAATARSMRAIIWANQPSRWRRLALLAIPGGEQLGFTLREQVAALRDIPTLVLWGSSDRVISARDAAIFRAASRAAEVHVAPGVGHLLPLEAVDWVNGHLARFIEVRLSDLRPAA